MSAISATHIINHRYGLYGQIGEGSFGKVYRAEDRLTADTVALKYVTAPVGQLMFSSRGHGSQLNLALAQEFRMLASLRHPHIISVLDYGFDQDNQPYFTMELLETSESILKAGEGQSVEVRVRMLIELLEALIYLHRRAILHRDLKPANVLVTDQWRVKVLDFGLSTTVEQAEGSVGTLLYMAPEALRNQAVGPASDIFAVGVIAYQLLTGRYPFDLSSSSHVVSSILYHTPDFSLIENPDLASVVMTCLEKDPAARYSDADEVIRALSSAIDRPPPQESVAIRDSFLQAAPFVGRDTELDQLSAALDGAIQGAGSSWLVGGESGIGKSRLLDELRIQALVKGALVLRGQGVEGGGLPYQLWREPLRVLVLSTELSDLEAGILKELVPDIDELMKRDILPPPHLEGPAQQRRLIATIEDVFRRHQQPILLVLEDLQWTGESLEPLKHLNRLAAELNLLIVGNFRNDERPELPEQLPEMQSMTLGRLSREAVSQLARSMIGKAGQQPAVLSLLQKETEGNVFFLVEVVRALAEEAGKLNAIGQDRLPEHIITGGIQRILQRRLGKIAAVYQPLLKQAAIIGRDIDLHLLDGLRRQVELRAWLTECHMAAVFEVHNNRWRFTHDKLREQVLADIAPDEHADLYRGVAQAVEDAYADDDDWVEVLMRLWHEVGDENKELACLARLVDQLVKFVGDYDRAQMLIQRGLARLDANDRRRVSLLNNRSQYLWHIGDYAAAETIAQQALILAEQHRDQGGAADSLNNLGNVAYYRGHYEAAIDYYRQSVELFRALGKGWDTGVNVCNIGWTLSFVGEYDEAIKYVQEGNAIFESIDNLRGIAHALYILAIIASHQRDYDQAIEYHQRSLDHFIAAKEPWNTVLNLVNLGFVYIAQGQKQAAAITLSKVLRISGDFGQQGYVLETVVGFAHLYVNAGQAVRAARLVGMVQAHSALNSEVEYRLDGLLPLLEESLSADDLYNAQEQGQALDLETVIQELCDAFGE